MVQAAPTRFKAGTLVKAGKLARSRRIRPLLVAASYGKLQFIDGFPEYPRSGLVFPRFAYAVGLDTSGNFMTTAGTLFPIA